MLPLPAFALTATDVPLGAVRVGTEGSGAGTITRGMNDETLTSFDTSGCVGVTIEAALPHTFDTAAPTLTFTAKQTPAARTSYSCMVVMRDAAMTDLGMFQVTATGVAPILSVDTNDLAFGEARLTGGTVSRTFTVSNSGDAGTTLHVTAIATSGGADTDFALSPAFSTFALTQGQSRTLTVVFDPSATGARATDLVVTSDDPIAATETIALAGTGVNPVIATAMDPTDFGAVTNGTAETVYVMVSNSGSGTLRVSSAAITTSTGSWITFTTMPQASCDNSTSCTYAGDLSITTTPVAVQLRCQPPIGASGTQSKTLTFTSDSAAGGDGTVTVTCTAGRPDITATPTSLGFGNVEVGAMATPLPLIVQNTGTEDLVISSASFQGTDPTQFAMTSGQAGMQTIMPGNTATWMLTCAPTVEGPLSAQFRILSNAVNSPTLNVPLSCQGGRLTSNVSSINFGAVRAGDTLTRTFTLRNTSTGPITGLTAVFAAPADPTYAVENLPFSLNAGATATVTVRFSPVDTTSGTQAGETHTLRIEGSAGGGVTARTLPMTLLGDGLSVGYLFDPSPLAIGAVRWDQTRDATVTINNPYEATVRLTSVSLAMNTGTATGEITRRDATTFPRDLAPGASVTLTFRADPNNRLGALGATFTVNSDLGASQTPTRALTITATSTAPAVTADPPTMTYNFGPTDVDRGMVSKDLTITNSGDGPLDITSAAISGTGSPFTVVATTPATIMPGSAFTATVRYDPAVVRSDTGTLVVGVGGICATPAACSGTAMPVSFALGGRGIDRVFTVVEPGLFPETYRNPGSTAPVKDVVVRNTGEAPLGVTALMVTGAPVWSLVDAAPQTIPAGGSYAFKVRFAPTTGGKAPTGTLIITHDDNDRGGTASVTLNGFGKNPMLSVSPSEVISLGTTAVGFPVRLSDTYPAQLTVQNNDAKAFTVREVKLVAPDGEQTFTLDADLAGTVLLPGDSRRFDIEFSAREIGEFDAQLQIFLDEDTEPATVVQLMGTAVEVEVQGGGGCQAGGDAGGGALALLLIVGVAHLGARRRRAASVALVALAAVPAALARHAEAQPSRDLDLALFRPAPATTGELLQVESPAVGTSGDWELGLAISHLLNPLEVQDSMGETASPVSRRTVFDLGLAVALADRIELGGRVATMLQDSTESEVKGLEGGEPSALGDALVHAKVRLLGGAGGWSVAAAATVTLPTATADAYAGPGKVTAAGHVLLGSRGRRLSTALNLGFGYQDKVVLGNLTQGNRALFGAGASLRATDHLWLSGEVFGALAVGQSERKAASPVEALVGVRYRLARAVDVTLGFGTGVVRGVGAPSAHGLLGFELAPGARELAPLTPPRPYVPPPDRDRDAIADADDHCPDQAEDVDSFADNDGCPDPDNDFDNVADADDRCPMEREDKDGVDDGDGCPDLDDDKDGVSGAADKCAKLAEDKDGFEDQDGCPELDNDKDGIEDADDKCPLEPETINEVDNQDGCPDPGMSVVILAAERFELMSPIAFAGQTAKLTPGSLVVLDQIAATLRANPDILRLRVGAHVHPRNAKDQDLSDKRAQAVREYLVQWGIEATRIDARGFGSSKPLVKANRRNAAQINDRVELTIMERR